MVHFSGLRFILYLNGNIDEVAKLSSNISEREKPYRSPLSISTDHYHYNKSCQIISAEKDHLT